MLVLAAHFFLAIFFREGLLFFRSHTSFSYTPYFLTAALLFEEIANTKPFFFFSLELTSYFFLFTGGVTIINYSLLNSYN